MCQDKIKQRCKKTMASCVEYQLELPLFTTITDECVSIQDTTEDLYTLVGDIKQEIDLTDLTYDCGTLPTNKTVKNLIQFLLDRDCAQQELIENLQTSIETLSDQITELQNNQCP